MLAVRCLSVFFCDNADRCFGFAWCRVHKSGVPYGPASQQRLGPIDNVASNAQLVGRPKYLDDRSEGRSNHRPEGLAEEERRPFSTPAHLSDWSAHFGLRPTSPTGALTSISSPPLDGLSDRKAWPKHYFRLRPTSPTGDASNPCSLLFFNWRIQSRLGLTDRGPSPGNERRK